MEDSVCGSPMLSGKPPVLLQFVSTKNYVSRNNNNNNNNNNNIYVHPIVY
jgi:hypothetical protein